MIEGSNFRKGATAALGVFVLVNASLALAYGVRAGGDTGIYIDGASRLLAGEPLTARQPSYAGYIAFVSVFEWLGLGLSGVVAGQVIAATCAAAVVFRLASTGGGAVAGGIAVVLLAADLDTNRWHSYVLADSLFASMLVIATWLAYRASLARRFSQYAIAGLALIGAALVRPEGWFVLPAAVLFWLLRSPASTAQRAAGVAVLLFACAVLVLAIAPRLGGNVQAVGPSEMLRQGQTIWDYDGWRVSMPEGPAPRPEGNSALNAMDYAVSHPISTFKLMLARVAVHFVHVRPFFSVPHNVLIVAWLLPIYGLAVRGAMAVRRDSLTAWCAAVIATQTLVVALTHADWDGRYLAHVTPLIYPFAAIGTVAVASGWRARGAGAAIA